MALDELTANLQAARLDDAMGRKEVPMVGSHQGWLGSPVSVGTGKLRDWVSPVDLAACEVSGRKEFFLIFGE